MPPSARVLKIIEGRIEIDGHDLLELLADAWPEFPRRDPNLRLDLSILAKTAKVPGEYALLYCAGCSAEGFHSGDDIGVRRFEVVHAPQHVIWRVGLGYDEDNLVDVELPFDRSTYELEVVRGHSAS